MFSEISKNSTRRCHSLSITIDTYRHKIRGAYPQYGEALAKNKRKERRIFLKLRQEPTPSRQKVLKNCVAIQYILLFWLFLLCEIRATLRKMPFSFGLKPFYKTILKFRNSLVPETYVQLLKHLQPKKRRKTVRVKKTFTSKKMFMNILPSCRLIFFFV